MPTLPIPTFAETEFRKASRSEPNGDCVQVARRSGWVALRDDKTEFGADDDHRLLLSESDFDDDSAAWCAGHDARTIQIVRQDDSTHVMRRTDGAGTDLVFTSAEMEAFLHGVADGEFDRPT